MLYKRRGWKAQRGHMNLEPGDIQLPSNHSIIHDRTDYEDFYEPERRRHLFRLRLTIEKAS